MIVDGEVSADVQLGEACSIIYVDPDKEKSAQRKFDKYLVPVALVFIILSALDRNNVSGVLVSTEPLSLTAE